ncbi:MAG: PHP domain-containing protein [Methanomassiliicoccales archaeon]|nr:MAG: PHP domain-containing protein [Methanomassiliicoccales archaeon]
MMMDLHIHSAYSTDTDIQVRDILKMAKKRNLRGIAITDHNEIAGSLEACELAKEMEGFVVVRAVEISSSEGHILGYGLDKTIKRDLSPQETVEAIRRAGGVPIVPHPYRFWSGVGEKVVLNTKFSAIEGLNARSPKGSNSKAIALAEKLELGVTGGSDSHEISEIGTGVTIFERDVETEEEVLEEILKRRTKVYGKSRPIGSPKYVAKTVSEWIGRGMKRI